MTVASRSRSIRGELVRRLAGATAAFQLCDRHDRYRQVGAGGLRHSRSFLVDDQHGDASIPQLPREFVRALPPVQGDERHGHARRGVNREHDPWSIGGQDADAAGTFGLRSGQHSRPRRRPTLADRQMSSAAWRTRAPALSGWERAATSSQLGI